MKFIFSINTGNKCQCLLFCLVIYRVYYSLKKYFWYVELNCILLLIFSKCLLQPTNLSLITFFVKWSKNSLLVLKVIEWSWCNVIHYQIFYFLYCCSVFSWSYLLDLKLLRYKHNFVYKLLNIPIPQVL